jgi:4-alpha-glucanotransferase
MRAEANHRSEMVSQFLLSRVAEILEKSQDFFKVRILFDDYIGWCQASQMQELSEKSELKDSITLNGDLWGAVLMNGTVMHVPFGSSLYFFEHGIADLGHYHMQFEGKIWIPQGCQF